MKDTIIFSSVGTPELFLSFFVFARCRCLFWRHLALFEKKKKSQTTVENKKQKMLGRESFLVALFVVILGNLLIFTNCEESCTANPVPRMQVPVPYRMYPRKTLRLFNKNIRLTSFFFSYSFYKLRFFFEKTLFSFFFSIFFSSSGKVFESCDHPASFPADCGWTDDEDKESCVSLFYERDAGFHSFFFLVR